MAEELHRCKGRGCRHRGPLPHSVDEHEDATTWTLVRVCVSCGRSTRQCFSKVPTSGAPDGLCPDCTRPWDDCACAIDLRHVEVLDCEGRGWVPPGVSEQETARARRYEDDWGDDEWEEEDWDEENEEPEPAPPSDRELETAGQLTLVDDDLPF